MTLKMSWNNPLIFVGALQNKPISLESSECECIFFLFNMVTKFLIDKMTLERKQSSHIENSQTQ
jgi:hypothetical protein